METIVIYGPRACGKTTHKHAIAAKYGFAPGDIIDSTDPRPDSIPTEGAIVMSDRPLKGFINISFDKAMRGIERQSK